MRALAVSDLHLTDRPSDEYRWRVFDQVHEIANEVGATDLFILGDLTEFKDYHSSALVNRVVDSLARSRKGTRIAQVHILKGNHDGVDKDTPYFRFLRHIPWCTFYVDPTVIDVGKYTTLLLPHTREHEKDWKGLEFGAASHIFLHGTISGSVAETGHILEQGIPADLFKGLRNTKVLAGDIHVPQTVHGCVEYVGAPYPIRFGDSFQGRAVFIDGMKVKSYPLENIRKPTLTCSATRMDAEIKSLRKGDQVKILLTLSESQLGQFHDLKQEVVEAVGKTGATVSKVQLVKVNEVKSKKPQLPTAKALNKTPIGELRTYCKRNKVTDEVQSLGESILKGELDG